MRRATILAASVISVLALALGAMAYPAVVGSHLPTWSGSTAVPSPKTTHPTGDDNGTANVTEPPEANDSGPEDNQTAPPPPPETNETENETGIGNISVEHNVTVVRVDNTTWINGTIVVSNATAALVDVSFQIVVRENGTANVTFEKDVTVGGASLTIHGTAVFVPETRSGFVFGTVTDTVNGTVAWERPFGFAISSYDHPF